MTRRGAFVRIFGCKDSVFSPKSSNFAADFQEKGSKDRQNIAFTKNMQAFQTILLLLTSNIFMTLAWYGHLRLQQAGVSTHWPLIAVIAFSWGIAFIEYCFAVPANRIGFAGNGGPFSLVQLKVIQ